MIASVKSTLGAGVRRTFKRPLVTLLAVMAAVVAGFTLYGVAQPARHDRDWVEHLSRLPSVVEPIPGRQFHVSPVRSWSYDAAGPAARDWGEAGRSFDYADLRNVWFMLEPHPGFDAMAHTLVLFEFADDRLLGLTIEARREEGEGYDPFWGNWGRFELLYVWASAKDLLTRRAVMLDHEVYVYPLKLQDEQEQAFLRHVLARTASIERRPRLYNTLFSNCTNELAKAAHLGWSPSFIMTGGAARRLYNDGIIPGTAVDGRVDDYDVVRARSDMTTFIRTINDDPPAEFDRKLLTQLRERFGD